MFSNKSEEELKILKEQRINEIKLIDIELKKLKENKKSKNKNSSSSDDRAQQTASILDQQNSVLEMFFGSGATSSSSATLTPQRSTIETDEKDDKIKKLDDLKKTQLASYMQKEEIAFKTSDSKDDLIEKIRNANKVRLCLEFFNNPQSQTHSSSSNKEREESKKVTKEVQSKNKKVESTKVEKSDRITSIEDCTKVILTKFMKDNNIAFKTSETKDDLIEKIRSENKVRLCLEFANS